MRVLILSDIHANLAALEAVLEDAEQFDYEEVWCLGDVVGYGPNPNECIEQLRRLPTRLVCVAGNHDWAVLGRLDIADFNLEARQAVEWTRRQLRADHRAWLEELPDYPLIRGRFTITHGSPRHPIWEYILTPSVAHSNFEYFDTPYCLVGHTHVPVIYQLVQDESDKREHCRALVPTQEHPIALAGPHRLILNPGSVGQPRDSDPRAAYALLDLKEELWIHRRVAYPIELTQARMREAGLPERLILRLSYGW
ncbi:MAG: metallophosphoesterase family protein [Anaerolineae bacterium]|nr:metallophosphoesterase family protein [Anaerolineae bacterium]